MIPEWELILFHWINGQWVVPELDPAFMFLTDMHKNNWMKGLVYLPLLLFWIYKKRGVAIRAILYLAIVAGTGDLLGHRFLKPYIDRPRPNNYLENIRPVNPSSPQNGGLPSNHAINSFALAFTAAILWPPGAWLFFGLASLIGYSRVYVGVHFVGDILLGALVGIIWATLLYNVLGKRVAFFKPVFVK